MEITANKIQFKICVFMKNVLFFLLSSLYLLNAMFSDASANTHANSHDKQSVRKEMEGLACTDKRGIPYLLLKDGTMYGVDAWPRNALGLYVHVVVEESGATFRKVVEATVMRSDRPHKAIPFKAYGIIRYDPKKYKGGHPGLEMELDHGKTVLIDISGSAEQLHAKKDAREQIVGTLHVLPLSDEEEDPSAIVQQEYRGAGNVVYVLIAK